MEVASFAEIETDFKERITKMVWCNVATIDTQNRPRSRILHPIWEGATGWIGTRPGTLKAKHLEIHPYVSLAYIADVAKPVYADCKVEWVEDLKQKQRIWTLFKETPPPLGYDMGTIWKSPEDPNLGLLKLTPWRIELYDFQGGSKVWHQ